ncbi:beta-propeller domain-containing protein [Sphingomonas lenta]|nr:beta-propeller domain-containing protein [Sphingomonas lenta]
MVMLAGLIGTTAPQAALAQANTLKAFANDKELVTFLKRRVARQQRSHAALLPPPMPAPPPPAPETSAAAPVVAAPSPMDDSSNIVVTSTKAATPNITNTQEVDVDEGGIVKVHGDHLVVLRRGRLFTVALGDRAMRAVDRIDAFPPGTSGEDAWYDEMLISGDRVIVVGYSYARGGTEVNRFDIAVDGRLRFVDSHHLRSNDYYSSSNYASRLIGSRLIFYTPLDLDIEEPIVAQLPALRRWIGSPKGTFERTAPATRIYLPQPLRRDPDADLNTLHTVTTCDLAAERFACRAVGVLGSESRNFYVSGNAVYVWISDAFTAEEADNRAIVYRLPLDGGRPGAAQAWGGPVDRFSFREDRKARALDVLVRADSNGERMWRAEVSEGDAALLHLPLDIFGDGSATAPRRAYRPLPLNRDPDWSFHNRFVGRNLVYSAGEFPQEAGVKTVFVVPLGGGPIAQVSAPHGVDRIDMMGVDAVVIGSDARERLGFSAIELAGATPRLGDTFFLPTAREGERRSQAFFYRPDAGSPDGASGVLGLPISRDLGGRPAARFLGSGSAVAYLRRDRRRFTPAGELAAQAERARDDGCQASCVDWYGNARPIFLGDRTFALMGYELVEGQLRDGRITETGRLDFAPTLPIVRVK